MPGAPTLVLALPKIALRIRGETKVPVKKFKKTLNWNLILRSIAMTFNFSKRPASSQRQSSISVHTKHPILSDAALVGSL